MYATLNSLVKKILPAWVYNKIIGRFDKQGFKRYTANTLWSLLARTSGLIIGFVTTIFVIRYLGPENYGQLSYAVSFVGLFAVISSLGLPSIFYRELLFSPENRDKLMGTVVTLRIAGGFLASLLCGLIAFFFLEDDVSRLAILVLSATLIFSSYQPITQEFAANVEQKYTSIATVFIIFILNALKFAVIFSDQGVLWFILVFLFEPILYGIILLCLRIYRYGSIQSWSFDKSVATKLLRDSWPFIFIAGLTTVYTRIDQVILKHLLGAESVGLYDAAVRFSELWLFIPGLITISLYPAIANARKKNILEYKKRLLFLLSFLVSIALIVSGLIFIVGDLLILFIYGVAFAPAIPVLYVYIWSSIFLAANTAVQQFLITENKRFVIFFITLGAAVSNIALNFLLIPQYGVVGAAWSTLISYAILTLPIFYIVNIKHNNTK